MPELSAPILVPAIRLDRDDGEEEARALARARQPWVAGFLLFGGEVRQVERLTDALRHEAGRPIFISSDMERGAGQQIRGLTSLPDLGLLGLAGNPADAAAFGEITAREARSVGVDVIFAPVVDVRSEIDNPIVGTRALGFDAARVALLASAFCDGIHAGGALAVAKHFPGHGATREDSHDAVPTVTDSAALLELRDLRPFRELVQAENCAAVMTAHVAYPALDPSGVIATFSKPILARTPLIVFTDALTMAGANEGIGEVEAARRALRAGCHALLYPAEPERVAATLLDGAEEVHNLARLAAARLAPLSAGDKASVPLGSALTPELSARPASVAVRAVNLSMGGAAVRKPDVLWDHRRRRPRGARARPRRARPGGGGSVPGRVRTGRRARPRGERAQGPGRDRRHGVHPGLEGCSGCQRGRPARRAGADPGHPSPRGANRRPSGARRPPRSRAGPNASASICRERGRISRPRSPTCSSPIRSQSGVSLPPSDGLLTVLSCSPPSPPSTGPSSFPTAPPSS